MIVSASPGTTVPLLTEVTTGTGEAVVIPVSSKNIRVHARGIGTIGAGTIIIEEANKADYAGGLWSQITSITATDLTGGAEKVIHILATIGAIRARVGSNITGGGNVSVEVVAD